MPNSSHVYHIERDVPQHVVKLEEEKSLQLVYNIEVEGQPEYFANNVLVHNCCIAFQMRKYAIITANRDYQYQAPVLYDDIGL